MFFWERRTKKKEDRGGMREGRDFLRVWSWWMKGRVVIVLEAIILAFGFKKL